MLGGSQCSTGPASRSTKDNKTFSATSFSAPYPVILHRSSIRLPASAIHPLECIQNASDSLVFNLWNSLMLRLCCLPIRCHFWLLHCTANGLTPTTFNPSFKLHPSPAITVNQFCSPIAPSSLHIKGYCLSRSRHFSICWSLHRWNKLPKAVKTADFSTQSHIFGTQEYIF